MTAAPLPERLPIFPLTGAMLLPRGYLPLNIFEPRYKEMVEVARSGSGIIGMVQPSQAKISSSLENNDQFGTAERGRPLYDVGCAGLISNFEESNNGQYIIVLTGLRRFKIKKELPKEYQFREVLADYSPYMEDGDDISLFDDEYKDPFIRLLNEYFNAFDIDMDVNEFYDIPHEELVNSMAMICPFEASEKQLLLESPTCKTRVQMMMQLMDFNLRKHDISSDNIIH
ncbi:LON peptidase substrate-binding domain-containing protein [Pseudemcibacter aquimaris]|uniref:LON peptidase substrate-binding domain-containing protein n=1 Tax=Pseudemcibacter aquimaris TaxID=2857064 RepID=UPI002011A6D4|nr:LON peptidase substrate-binding domain-containing protein [Pseudemcibacter aquimaris]MCC3861680.1 LON peptidase substrate-binding domain-containing protein [Pseudemcibacter aquimaris]WDU58451.1 LON peptidase substrate-binding domain-containing protein [Pseudemcibacter aquimaris]